ncbi:TRAP transporter small permease subunit [Kordiimonas sp. SCSIO 12610]|uniref:TRAP transporter small permease subunit n=1 Tax=Kordiimonas sp. SCSIO 12610 TaxID=2829597 RepID=UPI002109B949|nr:TRAP transporter small permease [Kordiimonas sp. SCSIO 12610]UTW55557.1 TRAP transporter small permease [Kordiimonas sp. SCSIO 12610]
MPRSFQNITKFLDKVCLYSAYLAALLLCILVLLGTVEIFVRNLFSTSISFSVEYSGYLVAVILMLGSGQALKDGTHVRVTLLEERLSGHAKAVFTLLAMMLSIAIAAYWGFAAVRFAFDTFVAGTVSYFPSQTPLWIPQLLVAIGPIVLLCGLTSKFLRLIWSNQVAGDDV